MKRPNRIRMYEVEPCGRCRAKRGDHCRNYKGQRKAVCRVVSGCPRCAAQIDHCQHPERVLVQRRLFPPGHPPLPTLAERIEAYVCSRPGRYHL